MENNNQDIKNRDSIKNNPLEFDFHKIFSSQILISNTPRRGLNSNCEAVIKPDLMLGKALEENKPVSHFLDSSCFEISILQNAMNSMLIEMSKEGWLQEVNPEQLTRDIKRNFPGLINNILTEDMDGLQTQFQDTGISLELLSMIGGFLIQPAMRFLGESSPKMLLDAWELTPCPICGRTPSIVIKPEDAAWMFKCSFCGTEYKMDIFVCPNCKTEGSETKEFHIVGENQEYEIAECKVCKRYYKIINTSRLQDMTPEGLEDSFTRLLDNIAASYELVRLDE